MFIIVCVRRKLSVMEISINIQHLCFFSLMSLYIEWIEILRRQRKLRSKLHSDVYFHLKDLQQRQLYDIYVVPNFRTLR